MDRRRFLEGAALAVGLLTDLLEREVTRAYDQDSAEAVSHAA